MTTQDFIDERATSTLKVGDMVKMVDCGEADFYQDRIWVCRTKSYRAYSGADVVHLEGFTGSFLCKCLRKVA